MMNSLLPGIWCLYFLSVVNSLKPKKSQKKFLFTLRPNLSEKLLYLNITLCAVHFFLCIDIDCHADRVRLQTARTLMMGICVACPIHLAVMLVTAWITIIDGGKNKSTPPWAMWYARISYGLQYIIEVLGGWFEYRVGPAGLNEGALNGNVNSVKYVHHMYICIVWGSLSWIYGRKITTQLKTGSKTGSAEQKKIKRYCYTCSFLLGMAFLWRGAFLPTRFNNIFQSIPPCQFSYFSLLNLFILFIQYGISYAQQPGKKKYTTRAYQAVRSTVMSSASQSRRSTNRTSTGSRNSSGGRGGFMSRLFGTSSSSRASSRASSMGSSNANSSKGGSSKGSSVTPFNDSSVATESEESTNSSTGKTSTSSAHMSSASSGHSSSAAMSSFAAGSSVMSSASSAADGSAFESEAGSAFESEAGSAFESEAGSVFESEMPESAFESEAGSAFESEMPESAFESDMESAFESEYDENAEDEYEDVEVFNDDAGVVENKV